jgi:hypothetical protein
MIIAIIILSIMVLVLGYLVYANFKKAQRAADYCEAYVRFISTLFFRFNDTRDRIKEVDRLGAFQADDETGFIFQEMDSAIEDLYEFITRYVNTAETEEDKKAKD